MTEAKLTWSIWQALLNAFAWAFTRRGFHRFAEWITAMALERRGTHHHPVGPGPGAARRLEGPGILRRARLLAPRARHSGPDSPDRHRPGSDLARLPGLGRR